MAIAQGTLTEVQIGDVVKVKMPWSEVCLHMKIADRVMKVRVLATMAQPLNDDGSLYCPAITHGEAGIHRDGDQLYAYTVE